MTAAVLENPLPPHLSGSADQALARDTRMARVALITTIYMQRVEQHITCRAAVDRAAKNISAIVQELDLSQPLDQLKGEVAAIATSHSATWDVAGGGDR
jgi:hypothetical protein